MGIYSTSGNFHCKNIFRGLHGYCKGTLMLLPHGLLITPINLIQASVNIWPYLGKEQTSYWPQSTWMASHFTESLNFLFTTDLSWTAHINMICTKARRLVGMLYRQFYQDLDADTSTLKQVYVSNIRPHLEYACQVWDPYWQKDIDMLESVQKFAL